MTTVTVNADQLVVVIQMVLDCCEDPSDEELETISDLLSSFTVERSDALEGVSDLSLARLDGLASLFAEILRRPSSSPIA